VLSRATPPDTLSQAAPSVMLSVAKHPVTFPLMLCAILAGLVLGKAFWLDRYDSPLVHHLRGGQVPGTITPAWRNVAGELTLLGYRYEAHDLLVLYWQAQQPITKDYVIQMTMTDPRGAPAGLVRHDHPGLNLTSRWEPGQIVRDEYVLPLDPSQRPAGYYLGVAVLDPDTQQPLRLLDSPGGTGEVSPLGTVKLAAPTQLAMQGATPVNAVFGGAIDLAAVAIPGEITAGMPFTYTLYWSSRARVPADYQVFVHLLAADGTSAAGNDGPPRQGLYSTTFWSPGEIIADTRTWQLDVPPGTYQIEVGLYRLDTAERLALPDGQSRVLLDQVIVK
jgi:hypothetical protein